MYDDKEKVNTYLDYLYSLDYVERPVDVETFIRSNDFIGKMTNNGKSIYKIWIDTLKDVFASDTILQVVATGAIGIGKTYCSTIGVAYVMYRMLCLKDPWKYFNMAEGGKMAVVFFNLTKSLSDSKGFSLLQAFIQSSPWFMARGRLTGRGVKVLEFPLFIYKLASPYAKGFGTIGENVIAASMDEVDNPTESLKQKEKILSAYNETVRRFESRFVIKGETLGKFFLSSSKQDNMSFLNVFIKKMENDKSVYVADYAIYDAKPKENYCGETFSVMVGDAFTKSMIIDFDSDLTKALTGGFKVIDVPIELRKKFESDIIGSLRDFSGISVEGSRRYKLFPAEKFIDACYDDERYDPVDSITIKTGLDDPVPLIKHLDLNKIRTPRSASKYIHMDIAFSGKGDALGIAMACVSGWKEAMVEHDDGTFSKQSVPVVETDFVMRLKAEPGDEIPISKCRQLVLNLRSQGFNIKLFTADLKLASVDTTQILEKAGVPTKYVSLDRTPEYYNVFRDLVFEERWSCYYNPYLHFEYKNLEKDRDTGKVDHPDELLEIVFNEDGSAEEIIMIGSKDMADANTGAVVSAIKDVTTPMDADTMNMLMDKNLNDLADDNLWWVDIDKKIDKRTVIEDEEEKKLSKNMELFKSMLDKVQ